MEVRRALGYHAPQDTEFTKSQKMKKNNRPNISGTALAAIFLGAFLLSAQPTQAAEEAAATKFLGVKITPKPGTHVMMKDVNIRSKPATSGKKLGRFERGTRVSVAGYTKSWLAVLQEGKPFGFVFAPITLPLIEGTLIKDIRKRAQTKDGIGCDYNIHFEGKSEMQDVPFETADYEVWFRCDVPHKGDKLTFPTIMFMTEGPFQMKRKGAFQISLDVLELEGGKYEEVLSTTMLYDRQKSEVRFDNINLKGFSSKPAKTKRPAADVPEALAAAVETVLATWTRKTLEAVAAKR